MAVITLTSASGSPGVTTTALGMALLWPRPVVQVEADPTGGSGVLAGYFRGTREYEAGLIELALTPEPLTDVLPQVVRLIDDSPASFVAGVRSHSQSAALRDLWEPLLDALSGLEENGQDVLIDAGRLGLAGSPAPLLARADLTLLLTRTHLPALAAARAWTTALEHAGQKWTRAGVITVGEAQPYRPREVSEVLGVPVVASLPDDPDSAAVFHRGAAPAKSFDSGPLVRGLRAAISSVQKVLEGQETAGLKRVTA